MQRQKAALFFDFLGRLKGIWQSRIWRDHGAPGTRKPDKPPRLSRWLWDCFFWEWPDWRWMLRIGFFIARWLKAPPTPPAQQALWICLPMPRGEAHWETFPWARPRPPSIARPRAAARRADTLP